jgi:hypothetical protein
MKTVQISKKYLLRDDGKLFNVKTGEEYIPYITSGYYMIKYKGKHTLVHRLVAENFLPNPDNKEEIDHINRNKLDNRVENLRWVTHEENMCNRSNSLKPEDRLNNKENKDKYQKNYLKEKYKTDEKFRQYKIEKAKESQRRRHSMKTP